MSYGPTNFLRDKISRAVKIVNLSGVSTVARHYLYTCDIPTSACNKYDLSKYDVLCHSLNIARTGIFQYIHSEGIS